MTETCQPLKKTKKCCSRPHGSFGIQWGMSALSLRIDSSKRKILTCGTHLGETKLVASMTGSPDSDNMFIKLIFVSVGTTVWEEENNKHKQRKT